MSRNPVSPGQNTKEYLSPTEFEAENGMPKDDKWNVQAKALHGQIEELIRELCSSSENAPIRLPLFKQARTLRERAQELCDRIEYKLDTPPVPQSYGTDFSAHDLVPALQQTNAALKAYFEHTPPKQVEQDTQLMSDSRKEEAGHTGWDILLQLSRTIWFPVAIILLAFAFVCMIYLRGLDTAWIKIPPPQGGLPALATWSRGGTLMWVIGSDRAPVTVNELEPPQGIAAIHISLSDSVRTNLLIRYTVNGEQQAVDAITIDGKEVFHWSNIPLPARVKSQVKVGNGEWSQDSPEERLDGNHPACQFNFRGA